MTFALQSLIKEASMELGSDACQQGKHLWESEGGRPCPLDLTDHCSQAVYRCVVCGSYDYGTPGGPGAGDCAKFCKHGLHSMGASLPHQPTAPKVTVLPYMGPKKDAPKKPYKAPQLVSDGVIRTPARIRQEREDFQ